MELQPPTPGSVTKNPVNSRVNIQLVAIYPNMCDVTGLCLLARDWTLFQSGVSHSDKMHGWVSLYPLDLLPELDDQSEATEEDE